MKKFAQIKSRGKKQPQYYISIDKVLIDKKILKNEQLVKILVVDEIEEDDFDWFVGKPHSILAGISIYQWFPLVDYNDNIENFITADGDSLYFPTNHFNRNDYEYDEKRDCMTYKS